MKIGGFDISSLNIDCVLVDLDEIEAPEWHRWTLIGADAWERTRTIPDVVPGRSWFEEKGLYAAGIEVPFGPSSGKISMVVGAVAVRLPANILVERWAVNQWRKALGISNSGTKAERKAAGVHYSSIAALSNPPGDFRSEYRRQISTWPIDAHEAHCIALATKLAVRVHEKEAA